MLSLINKQILHILIKCLNGNEDLSLKIISLKNEYVLNELKEQHIEKDFYNWLSNDIFIRNKLSKIVTNYYKLKEDEKTNYVIREIDNVKYNNKPLNSLFEYYDSNLFNLGINSKYIRTTSISKCFKMDWWKTTEKNNIFWKDIHDYINFPLIIKVYKYSFIGSGILDNDILYNRLFINKDFRNPTIKEKYQIINNFLKIYYHYSLIPILELGFEQDFDTGYLIVDKNLCIF